MPNVTDVQYGFPIVARAVPANSGMLGQSITEGIVQPAISEGNTDDRSKKPKIDGDAEHRARRSNRSIELPIPMPFQRSLLPRPIEYTPLSRTKSAPPRLSRVVSTPTIPTPITSLSSVRADTRVPAPDEQWNADLHKRIERDLLHIVEDVQIVRDIILSSQPTESSRGRAQRDYENSMNNIRTLAQEKFTYLWRNEMSERKRALSVVDSNSLDVVPQHQWFPDSIRKVEGERTSLISPGPGASQNDGVRRLPIKPSPQQLADIDSGFFKRAGGAQPHGDIEQDSDDNFEDRYRYYRIGGREGEDGRRGDTNTRQLLRSPLYPSNPSTKPSRVISSVPRWQFFSQRNTLSRQLQPLNFQPAEYDADLDSS